MALDWLTPLMLALVFAAEILLVLELRRTRHTIREAVEGLRSSVLAGVLLHLLAVVAPRVADWAARRYPHQER